MQKETLMDFKLSKFNEYKENNRLEVKKASSGLPNSLWETYSAFANCYGGIIILGVSENKDGSLFTTGLKDIDKLLKDFWNQIHSNKVSVNLLTEKDVEIYKYNDDDIIVIHVPKATREQKPVYINNDLFKGTYRRDHGGDYHCTKDEVLAMLRDQTNNTMDAKIIENMNINDLNKDTVKSYRNLHSALHPNHVWEKLSDEEYLEKIGALSRLDKDNKLHLTGAGLLMFGDEYKILKEYNEYFLDYREMLDPKIRWTDRIQSTSGDWSGNLFDF